MNFSIWAGRHADTVIQAHGVSPNFFNRLDGRLDMSDLEENVEQFLNKTALELGQLKTLNFPRLIKLQLDCIEIRSPIEKIFFISLIAYADYYEYTFKYRREDFDVNDSENYRTLYIHPQFQIDKYKVDFLIETFDVNGNIKSVIVELDGHNFHDKDKHQRAYEKSRDRLLTRRGYKTLHFTGSELVKDPYKCVIEAFVSLGITLENAIDFHLTDDPFCIGFFR